MVMPMYHSITKYINTFAASDELSRQLMCISKCHWQVYSLFSTQLSHTPARHHSR